MTEEAMEVWHKIDVALFDIPHSGTRRDQAAAAVIAAAMAADKAEILRLRDAEDKAWIEARELVRGTNADLCRNGSNQTYRLIIEALTNAIHNRDLRTFEGRVEHLRKSRPALETPHAG